MKALILIDVQNEFTAQGQRPVALINEALTAIRQQVEEARTHHIPIVWIRHFNKVNESPAFIPGTWGSEFITSFGPGAEAENEVEMHKDVYGAFTGTAIGEWLRTHNLDEVVIAGFYTHGCVSTTSREALMAGLTVYINPATTATCAQQHELLGQISAEDSKKAALLHLANMGVNVSPVSF